MKPTEKSAVIKREKIRTTHSEVIYGSTGENSKPRVEVTKQDGRITEFRIRCTCGEIIHLQCEYDD